MIFIEILIVIFAFVICFIIIFIVQWFIDLFHKLFRKNCFKCKYWNLYDVASFGNGVRYKCMKTGYKNPHMIDCNKSEYWMKCKEFEKNQ